MTPAGLGKNKWRGKDLGAQPLYSVPTAIVVGTEKAAVVRMQSQNGIGVVRVPRRHRKDADLDLPVLKQARAEYAKLR